MFDALYVRCEVAVENIPDLSEEEFALVRRNSVGASDTSAVLGAMDKFRTADDVLANKLELVYTDEEKEISQKPVVRKGKDLEPLNLQKAEKILGTPVWKSPDMYRLKQFPHLTVNYDGLCQIKENLVPVEAKFVSTFGDKYYNFKDPHVEKIIPDAGSNLDKLNELAAWHGIPPYYLLQVQQQLMGTGSDYAYLSALRDKDWTLYLFQIPAYSWIQDWLAVETYHFWNRVLKAREARK